MRGPATDDAGSPSGDGAERSPGGRAATDDATRPLTAIAEDARTRVNRPVGDDATTRRAPGPTGSPAEPRAPAPTAATPTASRHGTLVGRYLLLQHIGAGGLGDVYSAFDTELERKVAIKLMRVGGDESQAVPGDRRNRMLREAQAIAQVRHANVVVIHDVGDFGDDVFIAMELLEGQTIDRWLAARRRTWQEVRDVFVAAARGLAAAHRVGLVHRDFKPGNVMVGDDGRVTVLDFGLARAETGPALRAASGETPVLLTSELTGSDVVLGTPQYMAPELVTGAEASPRSDQFAFCVALYRSLWGALPFAAESLHGYRAAAARGDIVRGKGGGVPIWLARAIERGLSADPIERHADMDALVEALGVDGRRRRRAWVVSLVALPLASAALAAASVWWWRPEPTPGELDQTRQIAEEARAAAARGHYIHPPPDRPDEPTAIAKVLELEAIEGAAEATADDAAAGLRDEMADALVALGDRYFERPGGPPFAVDFYAAALVFDPTRQAARDRVTWTPGQLADLAAKAERGGFSDAELVAAEPLAVLADPDPARREEKLRAFEGRPSASIASRSRLAGLALSDSDSGGRAEPLARSTPSASRPAVASTEPIAAPIEPAASPVAPTAAKPTAPAEVSASAEASPSAPDPAAARRESDAGTAALRAGRLGEATAAFHKALEHDRRDARALSGLAEVHFERSEYREAAKFAKLATTYAPKSSASWIMLGDARVKLLEYADARVAYEKARGLGAQAADARLERLARLVGG